MELENLNREELILRVKQLENKMELQEKFLVNVSHDLRSPINTILSILQSLKYIDKSKESDEKIKEYRALIKRNSYKMMKLVDNLIDTTKIEEKYYNLDKQAIDIVSLIENTILSIDKYAKQKSIELIFDTNVEESIVLLDPEAIDRVIVNLVSNAIKFSPKESTIMTNLYVDEKNIKIVVRDNGYGISEEDQKVIFNRFMQSQKNKESSNEGSGIGLSIVKSFVSLHNGSISVKSKENEGSEFVINLPINLIEDKELFLYDSEVLDFNIKTELSDIYM